VSRSVPDGSGWFGIVGRDVIRRVRDGIPDGSGWFGIVGRDVIRRVRDGIPDGLIRRDFHTVS